MAIFLLISKFSLPWQPGQSDINFNGTGKLSHLENPLFGATVVALCISRVLANFMLKFPHFRCHGNRGRADVNYTVKMLDLENHLFCATFMALRVLLAELWLFLSQNSQIFVTMATGVV